VLPGIAVQESAARYVACTAALRVVGFDPADRLGRPGEAEERDLLSDPVRSEDPAAHALRRHEQLAAAIGVAIGTEAYAAPGTAVISAVERQRAAGLLSPLVAASARSSGPLLAVAPGAVTARGRWSPAAYAAAVSAVHARLPVRVLLLGPAGDRSAGEQFARALAPTVPLVSAIGRAGPRVAAALLADSAGLLGGVGDTMQVAAAVGTACVAVSAHPVGSSPVAVDGPDRVGPWSPGSRVVRPTGPAQTDCGDGCLASRAHCIEAVPAAEVVTAVLEMLTRPTPSEPSGAERCAVLPTQPSRSSSGLARA